MKKVTILAGALLCILFGGCTTNVMVADVREIEDMEIVQTVGVDYENGEVIVTAATGKNQNSKVTILTARAATIGRALQKMQSYSAKKYIFFGHTKHFLIGEEAAEHGVSVFLEYVERGVDMRLDTKIYIVKGSTAEEAISGSTGEENSVTERLDSLEQDVRLLSESYVFGCGETIEELSSDGCALMAAVQLEESGNVIKGEDKKSLQSAGYAVIEKGSLAGYVENEAARGLTILINKAISDMVEVPDGAGGVVSVEMTSGKTKCAGEFENGELKKIVFDVKLGGNIAGIQNPIDIYNEVVVRELERSWAEGELKWFAEVMNISRELQSDFIKAGKLVKSRHPVKFEKARQGEWVEQLAETEVEIRVSTELKRSYDVGISPLEEEAGKKRA